MSEILTWMGLLETSCALSLEDTRTQRRQGDVWRRRWGGVEGEGFLGFSFGGRGGRGALWVGGGVGWWGKWVCVG